MFLAPHPPRTPPEAQRVPVTSRDWTGWRKEADAEPLSRRTFLLAGLLFVLPFLGLLFVYWQIFFGTGSVTRQAALAQSATLSTLQGTVQVRVAGQGDFQAARDGLTLKAGDQIKTAANSRAVVTFFEGSTVEVEPESEIVLQAVAGTAGQETTIRLQQLVGITWARVVALAGPSSRFEIRAPSAVASVRGTVFRVAVVPDPTTGQLQTEVQTHEGAVAVAAAGQEVLVPSGQQTVVGEHRPPQPPRAVPLAPSPPRLSPSSLTFTVSAPGELLVSDPRGRSVGRTATGSLAHQIPGVVVTGPGEGLQVIELPEAPSGTYHLTLFSRAGGPYQLTVLGRSFSRPIVSLHCEGETRPGEAAVDLHVSEENHVLTGAQLVPAPPGGDVSAPVVPLVPRCSVAYR